MTKLFKIQDATVDLDLSHNHRYQWRIQNLTKRMFWPIFLENCMKIKKFGPEDARIPDALFDPSLGISVGDTVVDNLTNLKQLSFTFLVG